MSDEVVRPRSWPEWYRFAADELGFGPQECVEYANLRYVEEQNRAARSRDGGPRGHIAGIRRPGVRLG